MNALCVALALLLAAPSPDTLRAPDSGAVAGEASSRIPLADPTPGRWSVETSLTFPLARIYMVKGSYRSSDAAELGVGIALQNWENTEGAPLGQSNAWTLLLSYRRYLWRGLHAEVELWPAYNRFESYVDDQTYRGLELWVEYKVGYAVDLSPRLSLYVQPGVGHALWMQTRWPDLNHDSFGELVSGSLIFVPQVLVSWRL